MGTNITKEQVLRDVLNHTRNNNTSFKLKHATSRVSGVENSEDVAEIEEFLEFWKNEGLIIEPHQGKFKVPSSKVSEAQERLDEMKYPDDLNIQR